MIPIITLWMKIIRIWINPFMDNTLVIDKYKDEILMDPDWMDDDDGIAHTTFSIDS